MVAIHPGDGQQGDGLPGEAIWRLLTGVAHDSWEAICKHSPHLDVELKPRAGGGNNNRGGNNDNNNSNNNNNNDYGNHGGNGKDTRSSTAKTTPTTTTTPAKAASTPATTPTTAAAEKTTPAAETTPATTPAETTADAKATAAAASTPAASNDSDNNGNSQATAAAGGSDSSDNNNNSSNDSGNNGDDGSSGSQASQGSGNGNDVAASAGQASPSGSSNSNNDNNNDSGAQASQAGDAAVTDAPAAMATAGSGDKDGYSVYINANGQTTTVQDRPTQTTAGGALGAAATTGSTSSGSSSSGSSSSTNGTTSSTGSSNHVGVIAGVVVALALLLIAAALVYRFRRSKFLRPIFGRGSSGGVGSTDNANNSAQRLNSRNSVRSLLTPLDGPPTGGSGASGNVMAEKAVMGGVVGGTAAAAAIYNEKQPTVPFVAMAAADEHDRNDRNNHSNHSNHIDSYTAANLPPPAYPGAAAVDSPHSASASSSSVDSTSTPPPAGGRARSASRSSYSTFPSTGRPGTHRHNNTNSSGFVPNLQPVPTAPFASRRTASNGNIPAGSLPTPPPTAVSSSRDKAVVVSQPRVAVAVHVHSAPEISEMKEVNYAGNNKKPAPLNLSRPPPGRNLATSSSAGTLVPPPMAATARQRSSMESGREGVDNDGDAAAAQHRSSYGSIGGSSITSSVLMSPALLQWPVPPQTPPLSFRDGGRGSPDDDSQATFPAGPPVPSALGGGGGGQGARRPLTTASSNSSTTLGRGPMPTRAPLNGPSSRSLLQTSAARRPSLGGPVPDPGSPAGYGHISQQQPYSPQHSQQYHQQQYPTQKGAPLGYMQPQTSALTVHTDGQATSVRIPISRYQSPVSPSSQSPHSPYGGQGYY
ncbi:hypothetical protein SBRCBS47491_005452 [Sporothrix bragantina]|uniref:Uncharacterized protein n=1 Tax=Sporothrix bragantina TaxID=671064 RepID=A0ABP0BX33_9PEZI